MVNRIKQLDVLRAIAVISVIISHSPVTSSSSPMLLGSVIFLLGRVGRGVDLFFVLSGFLVSGLIFKEYSRYGTLDLKRFYIRRGLKIYPAFYFFLLIAAGVNLLLFHSFHITPAQLLHEALFVQNYFARAWMHTWSLAVEEHFYILLGLLLLLLFRTAKKGHDPFRYITPIFIFVACACLGLRIYSAIHIPFNFDKHLAPTHLRIDSLFYGVLLSYYYHFHFDRMNNFFTRFRIWIVFVSICVLLAGIGIPHHSFFGHTLEQTCLYFGFGNIMLLLLLTDWLQRVVPAVAIRAIAFVGEYSYSIYLWHIAILDWLQRFIPKAMPDLLTFAMYLIVSIAFGIIMASIIEFPFLRLRDKLYPSRSQANAISQPVTRSKVVEPA